MKIIPQYMAFVKLKGEMRPKKQYGGGQRCPCRKGDKAGQYPPLPYRPDTWDSILRYYGIGRRKKLFGRADAASAAVGRKYEYSLLEAALFPRLQYDGLFCHTFYHCADAPFLPAFSGKDIIPPPAQFYPHSICQ